MSSQDRTEAQIKRQYSGDAVKKAYALAYLKYRKNEGNCPRIADYNGLNDTAASLIRKYVKGE